MLLNKVLARFNLVFGILVACASVTSAAILINGHKSKLTSSGSTLPHLSGGGSSSSNEGSKSHGFIKESHYYSISGQSFGHSAALPELISSNSFPFASRPFDAYAFSVEPLKFSEFRDFSYFPKEPITELPTLTLLTQTNPLYPIDFERPELAVTKPKQQAADDQKDEAPSFFPDLSDHFSPSKKIIVEASTEESTRPITSAAPNKIEIQQPIPTPQAPLDTPLVSKKSKLEEIAEFIMPSQRDEFSVEKVNPTFKKNFENVTAQTPDTPLKTNNTKVKPAIFRDVKPPLRRSQSTERLSGLLLQNQNDADEHACIYEDLIEKMAALNLGQDPQEELQLPEQFSDRSVWDVSQFSEGSPVSMSEFSSFSRSSTPVNRSLGIWTPPSSFPSGIEHSPTHSRSMSTESLLSPSDRESQPSPSQVSDLEELLAELRKLDYSGLSDSESSDTSPSFSGIARVYQELFKDETPTRFGQPYGGSLIIPKPLPLPSNGRDPSPTLCEGISPEDEAWLASEDDDAQPLTSSLDESEETLSQTESYASSENEEDEFEEVSLSGSEYDTEDEVDEFGFAIPSKEHVVMLQEAHSEFRKYFTQRESEKAHQKVAQSMMSYGVFPQLLQTVEKIEHHTPTPASNEDVQIEAPAVAAVSPISKALIVSPYSQAKASYALFGEPSALYSPPYPVSPLSPYSRNPTFINGINISQGTILPHEVLWYGAMEATGAAKRLVNDTASAVSAGVDFAFKPLSSRHSKPYPNWAMPLAGLEIACNPMLLGVNAALKHYQKPRIKRTYDKAFGNVADTPQAKRVATPMREELISAARRVAQEVTILTSPRLAMTAVKEHPLMPELGQENLAANPAASPKNVSPLSRKEPETQMEQSKHHPHQTAASYTFKPGFLKRALMKVAPGHKIDERIPQLVEMTTFGGSENTQNAAERYTLSGSKNPRGLRSPKKRDFDNLNSMVPV